MELSNCLAYEVVSKPEDWLLGDTFSELVSLVMGAHITLTYSGHQVDEWRLYGSLRLHEHKGLIHTLRSSAFEHNKDVVLKPSEHWIESLRKLLKRDALKHQLDEVYLASFFSSGELILYHDFRRSLNGLSELAMWQSIIKRPFMWMGASHGVNWYAFLQGCIRAVKWLGFEPSRAALLIQTRLHDYAQSHVIHEREFYMKQPDSTLLKSLAFQAVEDL